MRRLLYNKKGLLSERFVLIEFPGALLAGFAFCLRQLQDLSHSKEEIAFSSLIAPSTAITSLSNPPPRYTTAADFSFKCDVLQQETPPEEISALTLKPNLVASDENNQKDFIKVLRKNTTLDDGQASALCENLCRGLAFTQGPPGTGKLSACLILESSNSLSLRQNISWGGSCQGHISIPTIFRPKANTSGLYDQPCS